MNNEPFTITRRQMLARCSTGFGALALAHLLDDGAARAGAAPSSPNALQLPHDAAQAKSVIFLFMEGGPSHIDLFDPKEKLNELSRGLARQDTH